MIASLISFLSIPSVIITFYDLYRGWKCKPIPFNLSAKAWAAITMAALIIIILDVLFI